MSIKKYLKQLHIVLSSRNKTIVKANIVQLRPNQLLLGRRAIITGGTSGIGLAIARAFINAGASVIVASRNQNKISEALSDLNTIKAENIICDGLVLDTTDILNFEKALEEAAVKLGGGYDILVNNAGINGGHITDVSEDEFDNILNTNLKGAFFLSKYVGQYFKENHIEGNILNISSAASLRPALSAYQLSKWGLRGFTQGLARALAPYNIIVNGIAPGPTMTPMLKKTSQDELTHPKNLIGRYAMPEEIANIAVVLCSDMGRTIVGHTVFMSGGSGEINNDDIDYKF